MTVYDVHMETMLTRNTIATVILDRGYVVKVYHTIPDTNNIQLEFATEEDMFSYALQYGPTITYGDVVEFLKRRRI